MADLAMWSGVIVNDNCTAEEAFAEKAKCIQKNVLGAKLALYEDTTFKVYNLDPQDLAVGHLGESVRVRATLNGNTLRVASLEVLADIGLEVGQMAPAFSARDQFGQRHTLDTLKGPNGTVLLFFRSADW